MRVKLITKALYGGLFISEDLDLLVASGDLTEEEKQAILGGM